MASLADTLDTVDLVFNFHPICVVQTRAFIVCVVSACGGQKRKQHHSFNSYAPKVFCYNEWWLCHLASMEQQKPTAKCLETCLRIKFAASTEPLFSFHHERDFFLTFLFLLLSLSYTAASKHKKNSAKRPI